MRVKMIGTWSGLNTDDGKHHTYREGAEYVVPDALGATLVGAGVATTDEPINLEPEEKDAGEREDKNDDERDDKGETPSRRKRSRR